MYRRAAPAPPTQHGMCCTPAELGTNVSARRVEHLALHGAPHLRTLPAQHAKVEGWVGRWPANERGRPWCAWCGDAGHGLTYKCVGDLPTAEVMVSSCKQSITVTVVDTPREVDKAFRFTSISGPDS